MAKGRYFKVFYQVQPGEKWFALEKGKPIGPFPEEVMLQDILEHLFPDDFEGLHHNHFEIEEVTRSGRPKNQKGQLALV